MPSRSAPHACFALTLMAGVFATTTASGAEDCSERFQKYGLFLQAKKSCGQDIEYPQMKAMRACAKATPQEAAIKLIDDGRREWARGVMRSSLGSMCEEVFAKPSATAKRR
ncbi:hypothetical protein [Methylobacterium iners]|uniref:Uncharacterized protein n=1 Tax=Methylobacterium iners TaxID=418707 RepID=A0ABQ4S8F7_9HYPH|nr:hypothetical protein [Methylobacterium iners]GJD97950.1 hypothetical protein OCOJLMKI_5189 [Methylobacterium iners]